MMKKTAILLLLASIAACEPNGANETTNDTAAMDTAAAPAAEPATPAASAPTDPQIASIVLAANQVDINAGELARERATDAQVQEFAQRMITDHTGVNQNATDLANRLGVTPEDNPTSQQLIEGGRENVDTLRTMSGAEFDRAYIANEVAYHQTVLDALDNALIPSAQNAELKALLEQTRPAIAAHLQMARDIQASLGAPQQGQ